MAFREADSALNWYEPLGTPRRAFPTVVAITMGQPVQRDPDKPERRHHRLAMRAYSLTDCEYYFTVCARHLEQQPFLNEALAKVVIDSLLWTKANYKWYLFCYCLMPDHLHFVCRLTDADVKLINAGARGEQPEGVLDHLARFKSYTTNRSWKLGVTGSLWQKSSYDRVLDMERPFEEVVEYVLQNPERAGLVKEWPDWPYARIVDPWW